MAKHVQLLEFVHSGPVTVNRESGTISGVKILGSISANGREYTPAAISGAKALYEGKPVNVNHPAKPGDTRSAYDRFGRIVGVEVKADGLYGTLEYLKSHPLAGPLTESAERMPALFGLSHNAIGDEVEKGGKRIVETIEAVMSVDLVADPATTNGLFESKGTIMKKTIKDILESAAQKIWQKAAFKALVEMDGDMVGAEMPADAPVDGAAAVDDAFESMVCGVFRDTKLDVAGKIAKIKEILKAQEKLTAVDEPVVEAELSDEEKKKAEEEAAKKEEAKKQAAGNLQEQKDAAKAKLILKVVTESNATMDSLLSRALSGCETEAEMKTVVGDHKKLTEAKQVTTPRSAGRVTTPAQVDHKDIASASKSWVLSN